MAGSEGNIHVWHAEALMCRTILMECRNEGMFVLCGFAYVGSSWYVAVGAWDSVQSADVFSSTSRDRSITSTMWVAGCP